MFKKQFLGFKTRRQLKKNKTTRETLSYNSANQIGIIFSADNREKHQAIKDFVKNLTDQGKSVSVLSFLGKGKENFDFLFDIVTMKDVNFWGSITNETAEDFVSQKFDYLFNFDKTPNLLLNNIMASSKAKCRIGLFREDGQPYFELMIDSKNENSMKAVVNNVHHYTSQLQ